MYAQTIGTAAIPSMANAVIMRTLTPAKRMVSPPAATTSMAVPRSGCSAIRSAGTSTMSPMATRCMNVGGNRRSCMNHATIIGVASFMSSDG